MKRPICGAEVVRSHLEYSYQVVISGNAAGVEDHADLQRFGADQTCELCWPTLVLRCSELTEEERVRFALGAVVALHGLVHLLYLGQAARLFELQSGMLWPDGSWAFSKLLGEPVTRNIAAVACALAAIGFVSGGVAVIATQGWWRWAIAGSAAFSGVAFLLLWDGKPQMLSNNGIFALIINVVLILATLVFRWPRLAF